VANKAEVIVSGDIAGVVSLPKQIAFAANRTTNDVLKTAQTDIQRGLKRGLHIRNGWTDPRTKFGVNVQFAKKGELEGSVGTKADWLLEEEGYHGGVKKVDHGNRGSGSNLAIPDIPHARPSISSKMPAGQKAGKLLANTKRTKAFKVRGKNGKWLVLQRVGQTAGGDLLRDSRGNLRIGRKKERTGGTKVVLKAVLQKSVRVPQKQIFTKTGVKSMNVFHYADRFGKNLIVALKTAK
jgi:hypothetical protein